MQPNPNGSAPAREVVIQTAGLTKQFGTRTVVNNLNLNVMRGDVFGFLGPNGAGKTTTIRMLLGLIAPTSGTVQLFGQDIRTNLNAVLHRVGAIVEAPTFYPHLGGGDNLEVVALASGGYPPSRIDEVLKMVDLADRKQDKYRTYSLGMKQRLAIAAAMLGDPELVMLDEPVNGLDPAGVVEIRQLIISLGQMGKTVFITSHNLFEIEQVSTRIAILKLGNLVTETTVTDLLRSDDAMISEIWVRVANDEVATKVLGALDFVKNISTNQEGYLVVAAPANRSADLNAALAHANIFASELRLNRPNLEAMFLELTEEPGAEISANGAKAKGVAQ
jgi:ABC-2 type transport system ATP-binding protein